MTDKDDDSKKKSNDIVAINLEKAGEKIIKSYSILYITLCIVIHFVQRRSGYQFL